MSNNGALTKHLAHVFLLATLLVYPFSVAGTNTFLALLFILAVYKFDILKQGLKICWHEYRAITIGLLLYAALTFAGAFWSDDTAKTIHKMGKQFKWLIVPTIIGIVYYYPQLRKKAFISLSIGLSLHLILCTLQRFDIVFIDELGSTADDATGYLGHLSFGFIYGIWIGALLIVAQHVQKKWEYLCYFFVIYATGMVFLAHGRSGYITTISMVLLVALKILFPGRTKLKLVILTLIITCTTLFFTNHDPSKQKILNTISGVEAFIDGDWNNVDMRIKIWSTSFELWKENPWFGIGTGDYKPASIELLKRPEFEHLKQPEPFASSHNEFIFNLTRWGPLGLLVTVYLCWAWFITGWRKDWQNDTMNAYLCTGSAITVILHGLTEVSLNSQLETTFATIILAFAMASKSQTKENSDFT